ncbi:hypothetical protein [Natronococcus jeotgali]|uniref:Uncharacterized protein n=1 Tax=Natronococcus jeotgali DSM 18795 TaxID=1227498 RepID=L9XH38_9EURY|nr:hypothetical protein [Natronococcus jeotgali]ELY61044.1 hypothetical protein C492_09900 [Natronococcus jeotgali DSM 18795]
MNKLRRMLGLLEGRENKVAKQISKRTGVSERQARRGIDKARELTGETENEDGSDHTRRERRQN